MKSRPNQIRLLHLYIPYYPPSTRPLPRPPTPRLSTNACSPPNTASLSQVNTAHHTHPLRLSAGQSASNDGQTLTTPAIAAAVRILETDEDAIALLIAVAAQRHRGPVRRGRAGRRCSTHSGSQSGEAGEPAQTALAAREAAETGCCARGGGCGLWRRGRD